MVMMIFVKGSHKGPRTSVRDVPRGGRVLGHKLLSISLNETGGFARVRRLSFWVFDFTVLSTVEAPQRGKPDKRNDQKSYLDVCVEREIDGNKDRVVMYPGELCGRARRPTEFTFGKREA
jgi:hypothetical protein